MTEQVKQSYWRSEVQQLFIFTKPTLLNLLDYRDYNVKIRLKNEKVFQCMQWSSTMLTDLLIETIVQLTLEKNECQFDKLEKSKHFLAISLKKKLDTENSMFSVISNGFKHVDWDLGRTEEAGGIKILDWKTTFVFLINTVGSFRTARKFAVCGKSNELESIVLQRQKVADWGCDGRNQINNFWGVLVSNLTFLVSFIYLPFSDWSGFQHKEKNWSSFETKDSHLLVKWCWILCNNCVINHCVINQADNLSRFRFMNRTTCKL